jgi:hypothetical protein
VITSRPATSADVKAFYPGIGASFRAWVAEIDGKPQGIIGITLTTPVACMFSAFNEPLRPFLRHLTVLRLIKRAQAAVHASRVPVWAVAEPTEPTAPGILERLGFKRLSVIGGDLIYEFRPGSPSGA